MNYRDFWEAGFRIFGLFGVLPNGQCECGNPNCEALYKHPRVKNWQHTPHWSEEQLETMEQMGHFKTGYGIIMGNELVVSDVDARNGGVASWAALTTDYSSAASSNLIVETGSGGGSKHHFWKVPKDVALVSHLPQYKGIDFRNGAAFVVGPGSLHKSGKRYEIVLGSPDDIEPLPDDLVALLTKPERHRAEYNGVAVDVSQDEIADMVAHIPNNDADYDFYIMIGMAIHHASGGTAFGLWDNWASKSSKYNPDDMDYKWVSFGKSANPVTLATLIFYAEQNGWVQPVTFNADVEFRFEAPVEDDLSINTDGIDLNRPPGFVGQVSDWIGTQPLRLRDRLSAMGAVFAVGSLIDLRYTDDLTRVTPNLIVFGVAGSGTGKEAVQSAVLEIMTVSGFGECTYGTMKSEQEVVTNLIEHQKAAYLIDEVASFLSKLKNAEKRGGAVYLEGVIAVIMSAYGKGNSTMTIGGDRKRENKEKLLKRLASIQKAMDDEGEQPYHLSRIASIERRLKAAGQGIERPMMSIAGYTTNDAFTELVDFRMAVNGFIGRSILVVETNTAPPAREGVEKLPLPERLKMTLQQLAMGGSFDLAATADERIEFYGQKIVIPTDDAAKALLKRVSQHFDKMAYEHQSLTGLEALCLRAYEQVSKVSLILAAPGRLRTEEHVRWAFKLVKRDITDKMLLVQSNENVKEDPVKALKSRIGTLIGGDDGETLGIIANKCKGYKKEDVEKCLNAMVKAGLATVEESIHKYTKKPINRYKRVDSK